MDGEQFILTTRSKTDQFVVNGNEYDSKRVTNIIRRYQELRSAAEITAFQYRQVSQGRSFIHGKDDIVCVLADIDQGVAALSSQQLIVARLLKKGYHIGEIGQELGISPATARYFIEQIGERLATYLNTARRKKGAKC